MSNINLGGVSSGGSRPSLWAAKQRLKDIILSSVAGATLDLRFTSKSYYRKDLTNTDADYVGDYAPGVEFFASHSRASSAWYPEWDFQSGSKVGRLQEYASDERRGGSFGVLDEGASTNLIRNPRCEGAVVGSIAASGAVPTNWVFSGITSSEWEVVGSGYVNGWPYVDIGYNGSDSSADLRFDANSAIAIGNGVDTAMSLGLQVISGSLGTTSVRVRMRDLDATETNLAAVSYPVTPDEHARRFAITHTTAGGGTQAYVQAGLQFVFGGAEQFVLRVSLPQLEQASSPSSPILPPKDAPAVSTRAADVVSGFSNSRTTKGWADSEWAGGSGDRCGVLQEFLPGVNRNVSQGLRVHQSSTNEVRNPRGEGAAAGTPGTLPTHWSAMFSGGSVEVTGTGVENGYPYTEIRFHAASPTGNPMITFEALGYISAAFDQKWSQSVGVKLVGGNLENINGLYQRIWQRNSSNSLLTILSGPVETFDTAHRRFTNTEQLDEATVASIQPYLEFSRVPGNPVDFTVRLYCPQAENAAFASDVILPPEGTLAASTRSDERLQLTDLSWYAGDEAEGTMVVEGIAPYGDSSQPTSGAAYLEGTVAARGRHLGYRNDLHTVSAAHRQEDAALSNAIAPSNSYPPGTPFRASTSWALTDPIEWTYDGTQAPDLAVLSGAFAIEALWIGYGSAGGSTPTADYFNGTIKAIKYFPRKLTEAEQQAQTA